MHRCWGGKQQGERDIEENIISDNVDEIILDAIKASDEGGEDRSPCSSARPRGCVECVA